MQGYICADPDRTVRVRVRGDKGFLTIKGRSSADGLSRYEWEKEIPASEAVELMALCGSGVIDKTRYLVPFGRHTYEVDVFHGANEGLVLAEIELAEEQETFEKPSWLGEEVTGDPRYYNSMLSLHPFSK
jgi:CYTH domain-containing protein